MSAGPSIINNPNNSSCITQTHGRRMLSLNHEINSILSFPAKRAFRRHLRANVERKEFSIIASNCIGARIYQGLEMPYSSPTVGMFFHAPCFIKFVSNLQYYLTRQLFFAESSMYSEAERNRNDETYPLGRLEDIELHFVHYLSEHEAAEKWNRRCARINFDSLYYIFTDRDLCDYSLLQAFDRLPHPNKVCFTAKCHSLKSCIQLKRFENEDCVGDLYTNYHFFNGVFDFAEWLNQDSEPFGNRLIKA